MPAAMPAVGHKVVVREDRHGRGHRRLRASVTGDNQPLHLDDGFGARTRFGKRIAHGMLSAGFISAAARDAHLAGWHRDLHGAVAAVPAPGQHRRHDHGRGGGADGGRGQARSSPSARTARTRTARWS